jgi:hypothetical protein
VAAMGNIVRGNEETRTEIEAVTVGTSASHSWKDARLTERSCKGPLASKGGKKMQSGGSSPAE